jgi:hypothetical protein
LLEDGGLVWGELVSFDSPPGFALAGDGDGSAGWWLASFGVV